MKFNHVLLLSSLIVAANTAFAAQIHSDPVGDVDYNIKNMCQDLSTDIVQTSVEEIGDNFRVSIKVSQELMRNIGYREYYFWIDSNPGNHEGYQPYNPDSVAWPDLYAKYRIFASFNANNDERRDERRIGFQDCRDTDCSHDDGIRYSDDIRVEFEGDTVVFTWPKSAIPALADAKKWKFGFTTYYEIGACNGEDDSPQWGQKAFETKLPIE